jgi:hypothetical protein
MRHFSKGQKLDETSRQGWRDNRCRPDSGLVITHKTLAGVDRNPANVAAGSRMWTPGAAPAL